MATLSPTKTLAVAIDAAEPILVQTLLEQGRLPSIKGLLQRGNWRRIKSPVHIGSGAVWPTFITGTEPAEHGIFGEWCWAPETMSLRRYSGRHLTPFWKDLASDGITLGLLDVPFAPTLGLSHGFEISEWGAHDVAVGHLEFSPPSIEHLLEQSEAHPYSFSHLPSSQVGSLEELNEILSSSLRGIRARGELAQRLIGEIKPDLAIVVFPETHHAGHYLWHTVAPDYEYYDDAVRKLTVTLTGPALADTYCEVDRQLGKLVDMVEEDAGIVVFSLHGMRPTLGIASFLEPLMCEQGFARLATWPTKTWNERSRTLIATMKRHAPASVKKVYYRTVPKQMVYRIAQPTMVPCYDWSHTRAFALQTDQHGRIRINLAGREASGIVPLEQYEETRREIEDFLQSLRREDGLPLVQDVIRTVDSCVDAQELLLPDLIVHFSDAAQQAPLRIKGSDLETYPTSGKYTGQHDLYGFCIATGRAARGDGDIHAKNLHRLLLAELQNNKRPA